MLIHLSNIDNFSSEKIWDRLESNLRLLCEKQVCYLCAMQSPRLTFNSKYSHQLLNLIVIEHRRFVDGVGRGGAASERPDVLDGQAEDGQLVHFSGTK